MTYLNSLKSVAKKKTINNRLWYYFGVWSPYKNIPKIFYMLYFYNNN